MDEKKINIYEKLQLNLTRLLIPELVKKTIGGSEKEVRPDPNSLSHFKAHEKKVHPDPNSLSHSKTREKKTQPGLKKRSPGPEKKTHPGLFFNLRLRKASKPLRERV